MWGEGKQKGRHYWWLCLAQCGVCQPREQSEDELLLHFDRKILDFSGWVTERHRGGGILEHNINKHFSFRCFVRVIICYLWINVSIWMSSFPLPFCLSHLAIQISLVWLSWFAWRQGFVFLSFYMPLKGKHQPVTLAAQFKLSLSWSYSVWTKKGSWETESSSPLIVSASASSCTGATGASSQLIVDFLPKASCCHLLTKMNVYNS